MSLLIKPSAKCKCTSIHAISLNYSILKDKKQTIQLCDVCWVRDNHLTSLQTPGSTCRLERCLHTQPARGDQQQQTADQQKMERLVANHLNELMVTSILLSKRKTRAIGTQVWNQTELRVQSISQRGLSKSLKWKERARLFSHYILITGLLTFRKTQGQAQITWTVLFGKCKKKKKKKKKKKGQYQPSLP